MATYNTNTNTCRNCCEYKEDCECGDHDDYEERFDDAWIDDQETERD